MRAVGIPYVVQGPDGPLYADFHALRHTYVSMLEKAGASLTEAKELARHSDIRLTKNRYTHADRKTMALAVDRLPLPGFEQAPTMTMEHLATAFVLMQTVLASLLGDGSADSLGAPRVAPIFEVSGDTSGQADTKSSGRLPAQARRKRSA